MATPVAINKETAREGRVVLMVVASLVGTRFKIVYRRNAEAGTECKQRLNARL